MTQQELLELVQVHHPDIGETQVRLMLNQAQKEFVDRSGISIEAVDSFTTDGSAMYYELNTTNLSSIANNDDDVVEINRVDYDAKPISRMINAYDIENS